MYYGILTAVSGGNFTLVIAICTIAMLFTASSYGKMVKRYPIAGSVYTYIQRTMHPNVGFMAGWAIMLDYVLLPMLCYLSFGMYLAEVFVNIPMWMFIVVIVVIVMALNLRGVTVAAFVDTIISLTGIGAIVATVIVSVIYVNAGGGLGTFLAPQIFFNAETFNVGGILAASGILCVAFLGFDALSTLAEETVNPEKTVGRAIVLVCLGAGLIFYASGWVLTATWPTILSDVTNPDIAIMEFYVKIGYPAFNAFFVVVNSVACIAISLSGQMAVSRVLLTMGRDGFLPKRVFGHLSKKSGVPSYNILITSAVGLTAILFQGQLTKAASLISFGALVSFVFVNIAVIIQYLGKDGLRSPSAYLNYGVMPTIGALISGYLFMNLEPNAKILGGIWLAVGIVYLAVKTNGFKKLPPEIQL
jgi:amino acid transporter